MLTWGGGQNQIEKVGQYAYLEYYDKTTWNGVSFVNIHLALAAEQFSKTGRLAPITKNGKVPVTMLEEVADIGGSTLHLQIKGAKDIDRVFEITNDDKDQACYYPGYYRKLKGIRQGKFKYIKEEPHCYCKPVAGVSHDSVTSHYERAGRIVLVESFRFNTMRRMAALVSVPVIASHYFPLTLKNESEKKLKAMTLWLNSTISLLLIANACSGTHGSKVNFSQTAAKKLPVLAIDEVAFADITKMAEVFDEVLKSDGLLPFPEMSSDPVRKKIDDAISSVFKISDLKLLRDALSREPIINNKNEDDNLQQ